MIANYLYSPARKSHSDQNEPEHECKERNIMNAGSRHNLIRLLLIVLLVQSVSAQADTHQFHQSGCNLFKTSSHQHEASPNLNEDWQHAIQSEASNSDSDLDCHHCCHCHRLSNMALLPTVEALQVQRPPSLLPAYQNLVSSQVISSILRPPIRFS